MKKLHLVTKGCSWQYIATSDTRTAAVTTTNNNDNKSNFSLSHRRFVKCAQRRETTHQRMLSHAIRCQAIREAVVGTRTIKSPSSIHNL